MIRWLALCLTSLLAPHWSLAEPILVRSGEHPGFTRLVFHLDGLSEWTVVQDGARVEVSVVGALDGFRATDLFDRISAARLQAFDETASNQAALTLACDCIADHFLLRNQMLVVDLRPRREDEAVPTVATVEAPVEDPEPTEDIVVELPVVRPVLPEITLPLRTSVVSTSLVTRMMEDELQSAAAAGLIQSGDQIRIDRADSPVQIVIDPETVETSPMRLSRHFCPPGIEAATSQWIGDTGFSERVSVLRADLFDLAGREVRGARIDLAKFFIANGAGVEALDLLEHESSEEAQLLTAMAQALDRPRSVDSAVFRDCPGLAIWEIIRVSRQRASDAPPFDDEALIIGFRGLSAPLQTLFETEVLTFLERNVYVEAHAAIAAYRERTHAPPGHLALIDGEAVPLPQQIDEHAVLRTVLARFETLDAAMHASEQEAAMVATFRHEYQGTSWAADLWQADLRLHLVASDFDGAMQLARSGRQHHPRAFEDSYSEMLRFVTDSADDIAFLKIAMAIGQGESGLPVPTADVADYVGARVNLLGF